MSVSIRETPIYRGEGTSYLPPVVRLVTGCSLHVAPRTVMHVTRSNSLRTKPHEMQKQLEKIIETMGGREKKKQRKMQT